jgi:4a-hydroxytetrahydrobiopterin dehydratase
MVSIEELNEKLGRLEGWSVEGSSITKQFEFNGFKDAMTFVNDVALIAESENHHPEIVINYNVVKLILITHSEGELTEKDFDLAEKIDKMGFSG